MSDKREDKINELVSNDLDGLLVVEMIDIVGQLFSDDYSDMDENTINELYATLQATPQKRVH